MAPPSNAKEQLVALLDRFESGQDPTGARAEATELIQRIGNAELIDIEERLVAAGMPVERMKHLCPSHMVAGSGERAAFRGSLPDEHPVAVFMDEHLNILAKLSELEEVVATVHADRETIMRAAQLGKALTDAEPHHAREEQVLFPALSARGIEGPPAMMEMEHQDIRRLKHAIHDDAHAAIETGEGWETVRSSALRLIPFLRDHIMKEDTILYPMAVQVITDPAQWDEIKTRCDAVGYCCHVEGAGGCSGH